MKAAEIDRLALSLPPESQAIPDELKQRNQWVVTKIVPTTEPGKKAAKIPICTATEHGASSTNPATWATFEDAAHLIEEWQGYDHTHVDAKTGAELTGPLVLPGFVFSGGDPYTGIDLDNCVDESGNLASWAQEIVDAFQSYTEVSHSGNGLHIIVRGSKPGGAGCKRGHVECYDQSRYFALTGRTLNGCNRIEDRQAELETFIANSLSKETPKQTRTAPDAHTGVDAEIVLQRAYASKRGDRLRALLSGDNAGLSSDSEGDLAACNILAFFCGNVSDDVALPVIDKIIRESGRYREKWDTVHRPADGATYGQMTIERALEGTVNRWKTPSEYRDAITADAAELMRQHGLDKQGIVNAAYDGQKGCADLFILLNRGRFCFDHTAGVWYVFAGHYWEVADVCQPIQLVDDVQALFKRAEVEISADIFELSEQLRLCDSTEEVKKIEGAIVEAQAKVKALSAMVRNLNTLGFRKQVVEFASVGEGNLGIGGTEWDLLPWMIACANGVVDLHTGELTPGQPNQYLKAFCPTPYDPAATAPLFLEAIKEIFNNDVELIAFVQRVLGMALVGEVLEHKVFIAEGRGRNGKDTLLGAVSDAMGPRLAGAIQPEVLLDQGRMRSSSGPSADIMRLQGLRLAIASETNEDCAFDASKLKLLTGGGELVGRAPYARREITFKPSHTLVLMTNSRPHAHADDYALWKRLTLIPFRMSFVEEPQYPHERQVQKDLPGRLRAEASGILNWLIQGCLQWQRIGLNPPAIVKRATLEYRRDEDVLQQFVDDACVVGDEVIVGAAALYSHYRVWAQDNGIRPMTGTKFGRKMAERFQKEQMRTGTQYIGIGLPATG